MNETEIENLLRNPSYREEANALICECLRNGFIEDLHERITQEEMKKLMIKTTAKLAHYLEMKKEKPEKYNSFINFMTFAYTSDWSKDLKEYNIES